ncbi:TIR domain-containing protein [Citricoccus alkalitolerans]|uniref:TIR domain-containing protein n=1 Tax=Citricoccus alkalitolerans TaxID=246603 RepID=A0ABV8Y2E6_9MICC
MLNSQAWYQVHRNGTEAIRGRIDDQLSQSEAVIVLIGNQTATRKWVRYEIEKAWQDRKPLLGVYIHGLPSNNIIGSAGPDPFDTTRDMFGIPVFSPTARDWRGNVDPEATFENLSQNLET